MKNIKVFIQAPIVLLLVIGISIFLWKIGLLFVKSLVAIDPLFSASIIGAMATIIVSISATIITQTQIKLREVEEAYRTKKVEVYEEFLNTVTSLVMAENNNVSVQALSQQDLVNYWVKFKTNILLWGSPEVIKCQLAFELAAQKKGNVFIEVDNLYKAIRKDLGLSNQGLNNYELIKMYLKDPQELDQVIASKKTKI